MASLLLSVSLSLSNGIVWVQGHGVTLLALTSIGLCLWVVYLWFSLVAIQYRLDEADYARKEWVGHRDDLKERLKVSEGRLRESLKTEAKLRDHIKRNLVHTPKNLSLN